MQLYTRSIIANLDSISLVDQRRDPGALLFLGNLRYRSHCYPLVYPALPSPMARPQTSPILAQLRNAKTCPEQSTALQALKNEIIGHHQKKETWVSLGVLEPVIKTLTSARPTPKSNTAKDARPQASSRRPLSDEDDVRLQALQIITSFAKGMLSEIRHVNFCRTPPCSFARSSST